MVVISSWSKFSLAAAACLEVAIAIRTDDNQSSTVEDTSVNRQHAFEGAPLPMQPFDKSFIEVEITNKC